jgi:hypothetical protein
MSTAEAERSAALDWARTGRFDWDALSHVIGLLQRDPSAGLPMVTALLANPMSSHGSVEVVLAHLSDADLAAAVDLAVRQWLAPPAERHDVVEHALLHAALQAPHLLAPHLAAFRDRPPNPDALGEEFPWRGADDAEIAALLGEMANDAAPMPRRRLAWRRLLETRRPEIIARVAAEHAPLRIAAREDLPAKWHELLSLADRAASLLGKPPPSLRRADVNSELHEVGFDLSDARLRRLHPDAVWHIRFPDEYLTSEVLARRAAMHPTWRLPTDRAFAARLGGALRRRCRGCGGALHRLLALEPLPPGLGISELSRLELATCLACLGWTNGHSFYRHDSSGAPTCLAAAGAANSPIEDAGPLRATAVALAPSPSRWRMQCWVVAGDANLNRVGGEPTWIQSAEYPECPQCSTVMPFLAQLNSPLPAADGEEFLFGSGGIAYAFWCDGCRISAWLWQCT